MLAGPRSCLFLLFCSTISLIALYGHIGKQESIKIASIFNFSLTLTKTMSESNTWPSEFSGYLARATPYPFAPESFTPKRSLLDVLVLRNAPIEPEGITLALFSDRTIVEASGKISIITEEDYTGIRALAQQTRSLPKSDNFRNQWRVKHDRTSHPIDRVLVVRSTLNDIPAENYELEYEETSVYGFDKQLKTLDKPIGDYEELAQPLYELTGLAWEAREGKGSKDEAVLTKVRNILGNVF
ncbi:hypothetical protein GALMADRAFT_261537 [Galerina marginata CBS 339.88]|uniref:Uncharacterized protein n=1 Tax=Galerina marginata (strain CBS 339.88) TaxID=685588 RepID=A0A067TRT5_GALM3|nr:hypothetical protein GALMADRAFT_261537 [Galerina marginata CBS 339.88]